MGNRRFGESNGRSVLKEDDVKLIRQLDAERREHWRLARQLSQGRIAEKFGVSLKCVHEIANGITWAGVDVDE